MMFKNMPSYIPRLLFGTVALILVVISIILSREPTTAFILALLTAALISLGMREYYNMAEKMGYQPQSTLGIVGGALTILSLFSIPFFPQLTFIPIFILTATFFASFITFLFNGKNPLVNLSITFFGIIYLPVALGSLVLINYFFPEGASQDGRWWMIYLLAVTYITNSGAYLFGKTLGRTKFAPAISPKKTWEGAIGGFIFALITSFIFYIYSPLSLTLWQSVWLGGILSILGQIGDLAESLLKRDAGVKDSAHIPGLGGVLDVIDSLIFTAPALYLFLKMQ